MKHLSEIQNSLEEFKQISHEIDYPIAYAVGSREFTHMLELPINQGMIENPVIGRGDEYRLTLDGWSAVADLDTSLTNPDQAFIAMWFDNSMDDARDNGFIRALEATGFTPFVLSLEQDNEMIDDRILFEIPRSGLVVADVTGHRNGVYFEAGLARGLGIPLIWSCREDHIGDAHFDTRQFNHVVWADSDDLREQLELRIRATIPGRAAFPRPSGE